MNALDKAKRILLSYDKEISEGKDVESEYEDVIMKILISGVEANCDTKPIDNNIYIGLPDKKCIILDRSIPIKQRAEMLAEYMISKEKGGNTEC